MESWSLEPGAIQPPSSRPAQPDCPPGAETVSELAVTTDTNQVIEKYKAAFPRGNTLTFADVNRWLSLPGVDLDLVSDVIDYTSAQAQRQTVNSPVGFMAYQFRNTDHEKIRAVAEDYRNKVESDPETIVKVAMQKTEARLRSTPLDAGPDTNRMNRLRQAVQERRGGNGSPAPA